MSADVDAVDPDHRPAILTGGLSLVALLFGVVSSALYSPLVLAGGAAALAVVGAGLWTGSRRAVTIGTAVALAGLLAGGVRGVPAVPMLASVTATVLAWDAGHHAIGIGNQLGREAATARAELPHVGATVGVGLVAAVGSYAVFVAGPSGQPVAAVIAMLFGAVLLLAALQR
ncbi:hypothetical protein [Haloterrigena salinisoli]|uniref:DUF7519 family protein n=1 Tax=Haloterrigena salinisoli TaxID=3132747 RepID=UPI0030D1C3FD